MRQTWLVAGVLGVLAMLGAASAHAQDEDFRDARIRHLEPGVVHQRATESASEEAVVNAPFLPGDRIWTDSRGRAEFQFSDGTVVRLDVRGKLDYVAHEGGRRAERIVLRLWSGGAYVRSSDGSVEIDVETPGAVVEVRETGVYRIDVASGETRLSVVRGEAVLDAAGRVVRLGNGERSYARAGETPENAQEFEDDGDDFARWDYDREDRHAYAGGSRRYLPEEMSPYAEDLDANGTWYYEPEVGHVWRPAVASSWSPYADGRWIWTAYGWTWVPSENWGWAPFHYGRWGYSRLGWYWIPGSVWAPAWVDWAVGGDYVGWCPLGYRDRPVAVGFETNRFRGYAVPRSGRTGSTWIYARRDDLSARDLIRRRVTLDSSQALQVRHLESPHLRPDRELKVVEMAVNRPMAAGGVSGLGGTAPHNVRTKPTPGDTVPELRSDPATTIPFPSARRRRTDDSRDEYRRDRDAGSSAPRPIEHPADNRTARPSGGAASGGARPSDRDRSREEGRPGAHPTDVRSQPARDEPRPSGDSDREVLRQFFRPLSPRSIDRSEPAPSAAPREDRPAPRSEPRSAPREDRPEARPYHNEPRPEPRAEPRSEPRAPTTERAAPHHEPRPQPAAPRAEPRPEPRPTPASSTAHSRDRDR